MKFCLKIFLIIFLLQLAGCKWFSSATTPMLMGSSIRIPDGTPVFQQGFKDGCGTVLYARGNVWYRTRYSYKYDPKLIDNPEYRFGHSRGYSYCFQTIIAPRQMGSFDRYISPYGQSPVFDWTISGDVLGNAWGGFFNDGPMSRTMSNDNGFDEMFGVWQGSTGTALGANPLWAGGSAGQILGQ